VKFKVKLSGRSVLKVNQSIDSGNICQVSLSEAELLLIRAVFDSVSIDFRESVDPNSYLDLREKTSKALGEIKKNKGLFL